VGGSGEWREAWRPSIRCGCSPKSPIKIVGQRKWGTKDCPSNRDPLTCGACYLSIEIPSSQSLSIIIKLRTILFAWKRIQRMLPSGNWDSNNYCRQRSELVEDHPFTALVAAAWAPAIGLLRDHKPCSDITHLDRDTRCDLYWSRRRVAKKLCGGKLMGYFFAKMYSFQVGFAMI
jgi:hypothetical protein